MHVCMFRNSYHSHFLSSSLPMDSRRAAALVTTRALGMKLGISGISVGEVRVTELALANELDGTALLLETDEIVDGLLS